LILKGFVFGHRSAQNRQNCPTIVWRGMKDLTLKLLYSAAIALLSFAPLGRAQSSPNVVGPRQPVAVQMSEGSNVATLAADLLSVGAVILVFRRAASTKR
jgi:hypothetical protein